VDQADSFLIFYKKPTLAKFPDRLPLIFDGHLEQAKTALVKPKSTPAVSQGNKESALIFNSRIGWVELGLKCNPSRDPIPLVAQIDALRLSGRPTGVCQDGVIEFFLGGGGAGKPLL